MNQDFTLAAIQTSLNRVAEDVKDVRELLTGNGEPEKGLVVRTDRLEQTASNARKFLWLVLGITLTPDAIHALVSFIGRQ